MRQEVFMKRVVLLSVALVFLLSAGANAGQITPDLDNQLAILPEGEFISTIVMLKDQVDLEILSKKLDGMNATREYRHERVVLALQAKARETQGELITFLERGVETSKVSDFTPIWIANLVIVDAQKEIIERLSERLDVGDIYLDYMIENIKPISMSPAPEKLTASIEEGLQRINAPAAWDRGYTGAGRLVSHLDTGVAGLHHAFEARWRGHHHPWQECWYDPVTHTNFPFDSGYHGTHTMGTMCGYERATNDHIGVAYGAQWISAGVIDRVNIPTTIADAVTAFEWIADPDEDPGTVDDVPDVCSNSWGISPIYHGGYLNGACDQVFWDVLDGCEAAGVVVVFAAGNEGNNPPNSMRNPSNRATTQFNTFSVGAIDGADYGNNPAASFSSRGPAPNDCGNNTTKPEVTAPGVYVRSSRPGQRYMNLDGTSMSCPHVAGAVAILRQADPNATSAEIKFVLMQTARDLGSSGEDNTYGWGLIDLDAALDYMGQGCWWESNCEPIGDPIIIPEEGGSFSYDVTFTNHCEITRFTDLWTMVKLPSGALFGPVLLYQGVSFTENLIRNGGITHDVGGKAPAGTYTYRVYCGDYPSAPSDSCYFGFEKLGTADSDSDELPFILSTETGGEADVVFK
jgi:bacillopeptidase F